MGLVIGFIVNFLAIYIAAYIIPGVTIANLQSGFFAAVVLGLINTFIKPIVKLLALPITILTLGLFSLVINTLIIMATAWIVEGFTVDGFITAFIYAIVLSIVSTVLGWFMPGK